MTKIVNNNDNSSSGGMGFVGFLTILFIALKLTGFIAWSWWWVLSPLWISSLILIVIFVVGLTFVLLRKGK
jgi:fatty acid desaturase